MSPSKVAMVTQCKVASRVSGASTMEGFANEDPDLQLDPVFHEEPMKRAQQTLGQVFSAAFLVKQRIYCVLNQM